MHYAVGSWLAYGRRGICWMLECGRWLQPTNPVIRTLYSAHKGRIIVHRRILVYLFFKRLLIGRTSKESQLYARNLRKCTIDTNKCKCISHAIPEAIFTLCNFNECILRLDLGALLVMNDNNGINMECVDFIRLT